MFSAGRDTIISNRASPGGVNCETFNVYVSQPSNIQARIDCDPQVAFSQYTAVHELGHVFEGRTGGTTQGSTFFGLMDQPVSTGTPGGVYDYATLAGIVFGNRIDPVSQKPDWVRGNRGWGSAASTPPAVPCNFQQDPFTVADWLATQDQRVRERDEAAADMFLNWVYTAIAAGGFQNTSWIGINMCATGTAQPAERPGDVQNNYMNNIVLPTLATYVPTSTPTPTPTP